MKEGREGSVEKQKGEKEEMEGQEAEEEKERTEGDEEVKAKGREFKIVRQRRMKRKEDV